MPALWSLFLGSPPERSSVKWKHYFPIYERHFARYVNQPVTVIEIGCGDGGSLQLWKRYLGPHARIVGLDIRPVCKDFEEDQIAVRIGSQSDPQFLGKVLEEFGTPDIVIDDGSHQMVDVKESFEILYHRLDRRGVYLVEDMHTAYMDRFGGGIRRKGTFIEICKDLIDQLTAVTGGTPVTEFTRSTLSMHFYDSVVVFERGWTTHQHMIKPGGVPA